MSTNSRKALANYILRCDPLDRASKLLALDFYFDDMSSALDVSSQAGIVSSLHLFHEYSLLMRDCALENAPLDSLWFCTLFQIERDGEEVRTKPGTFIYEGSLRGDSPRPEEQSEASSVSLSIDNFSENINRLLWERLNTRISEKDRISSRPSIFDPCIQVTLHRTCALDHSASHHLDESWFNQRVRFHLQQIMILDNLHTFGRTEFVERIRYQRLVVIAHCPFIFILKLMSARAAKTPPRRLGKCHEPTLVPHWLDFFPEQRLDTRSCGRPCDGQAVGLRCFV
jgi:hypothetical protein